MNDIPKREIEIKERSFNPIFLNEEVEIFERDVYEYIKSHGIRFDGLDRYSKIRVLQKMIGGCKRCGLYRDCNSPLYPVMNVISKASFIIRNPSKSEEKIGVPLHSDAPGGKMFNRYLNILGLSRAEIHISNMVHCRSEKNKVVQFNYASVCSLWKYLEFKLIEVPKYIFTLGPYPLKMFMGYNFPSVLKIFGDIYKGKFLGEEIYLIPIIHPGYILRTSEFRDDTERILKYVRREIL